MRKLLTILLLAAPSLAFAAAPPVKPGGGKAPLVPVSGRVTLDGKPLADALVVFHPVLAAKKAPGLGYQGRTDAAGRFTLRLDKKARPGAPVGTYRVSISKAIGAAGGPGGAPVREIIPARYNASTALTFEVPKGGTDAANFELASR
jgi:hypothetical protein